ncbi:MAG: hypothetical protein ACYTGQ_01305 [Planctomycetota bacterium]
MTNNLPGKPSFEAAELGLKEFLAKNLHPNRIAWVFSEDISSSGTKVWVRWPIPDQNTAAAKRHYEQGLVRGFGIAIRSICVANKTTCCYVWSPPDEYEAAKSNLGIGLRYSVMRPLADATPVTGAVAWSTRKRLNTLAWTSKTISEIPLRG